MKTIENFADLNEVVGGFCPSDPESGNPTFRATNPNAWDYEGYDPNHPHC